MVNKKKCIILCIIAIIFTTNFHHEVQAKSPNVNDWLDENKDSSDTDGRPPDEADDTSDSPADTSESSTDGSTGSLLLTLVKMAFALLLVLGLIYLLLQFLKKRNKLFSKVKALENLGGITVGQNKSLQIVRIGSRYYVIGVGENIEMLHEITDEEVIQDLLHEDKANEFQPSSLLASFLPKKSAKDGEETSKKRNDFKQLFSNELNTLKQNRKKIMKQHKEDKHE